MRTCASCGELTSRPSTSSAEDSPARTSASPAAAPESTGSGRVFGRRCSDSLMSFDRDTCSWRTSQLSFLAASIESSPTLPASGSMRSGTVYEHRTLGSATAATESGLLPTPVAKDDGKSSEAHLAMKQRMKGGPRNTITSLAVLVRADFQQPLLKTPTASPWAHGGGGGELHKQLGKLLPTPRTSDTNGPGRHGTGGLDLRPAIAEISTGASTSQPSADTKPSSERRPLSPFFEEWMLGYPSGWTVCAASATALSRRSPSGLVPESSSGSED
jgi:hypothetical protein